MCRKNFVLPLLLSTVSLCLAANSIAPSTTLSAQRANNTSAPSSFVTQSNGNIAPKNVSKVDVHSLLYAGATTKIYAHLMLWFGGSNHMNVGYSSTDAAQVHRQVTDMISRGIDGVIIDWYGPNNSIDQATKLVMAEAEKHAGFTFAIMVDQGAIQWDSCSGCTPQAALINQLQYVEQTYFPSPAYMRLQGRPVVTNFNIDLSYSVNWSQVNAALSTQPLFIFQNNNGFTHTLTDGSYSWVMPTTTDYGMGYLTSFYDTGLSYKAEETVGASYKGFNDTLASWGSNRIMGQQCGQTWLATFSKINSLYDSGQQLPLLQLVTWNDYEEGTEIETGISNCLTVSASVSGNSLRWAVAGHENTVDHYIPYISSDGQNLMSLGEKSVGTNSLNLCSYSLPNGSYLAYVQAIGKPNLTNQISGGVKVSLNCGSSSTPANLKLGASPSAMNLAAGTSGSIKVTVAPESGSFNNAVALTCSGLPSTLSCAFAPASVTPGATAVSSSLTVKAAAVNTADGHDGRNIFFGTGLFGFGVFAISFVGAFERRRLRTVIGIAGLAVLLIITSSCGSQGFKAVNASATADTYVVTINGTASSTAQVSTTVAITVN
jgi:hypothetical protein